MLFIILIVCVVLCCLGILCISVNNKNLGINLLGVFGTIVVLDLFIILCCLIDYNYTKSTADSKIKVHEEQIEIVSKQIEPLVERYLNWEKDTYSNLKIDAVLVAMSMYPELKGNEFVQSQIKLILDNQEKIEDLKLDKASLNVYEFWLFMGE